MKILAISLLRLGDILLATSVLRSLKRENPKAEIHILINKQFEKIAPMIPYVDKVHAFDRDTLQKIIGSSDRNLIEAYYRVEDLVKSLRSERYDQVINLTHNRLSGWLTTLVGCSKTRGVVLDNNGRYSLGSNWFEYLNDFVEPGLGNIFHFVDVFHYGSGLETIDRRIELLQTQKGKDFAAKTFQPFGDKTRVLIQATSNESKKTLAINQWREAGRILGGIEPNTQVFVLGAPSEKTFVSDLCEGSNFVPVICDLDEAYSLLNESQILITCDTSIKHLACATKIKIIEVSIGSSEYAKTGVYTDGAVIMQAKVPCGPCPHSSPCSQPTHACAEKISPEMVSMVASCILRHDETGLRSLAHEYKEDVSLLRTYVNASGDWTAYPLAQKFSAREINGWVDRASFKLYLQKSHERPIGEYGSEGLELKQLLENIFPDRSRQDWVSELKNLERDVSWFGTKVEFFLDRLKTLLTQIQDPERLQSYLDELDVFSRQAKQSKIFESYGHQLALFLEQPRKDDSAFQTVKQLREKLSKAHQRAKIELKLIRGLQTGFMEMV